jgi:ABC-type nitrate/sulfonate/bicarbonate transport system substrate-binding protein
MNTTVRIGGVPEHFNLPWHLAQEQGLFQEHGLNATWQDFGGGTGAMLKALQDNELDVAILLTEGVAAALAQSQVAITPLSMFVATPLVWGIHVAANSGITTLAQLNCPTVAISRYGSGSHLMAFLLAQKQNWGTIQFEIVQNLQGATTALPAKKADIFLWEKFTTQPYIEKGIFRRIGELPTPWSCFVIVARTTFYQQHQDSLETLIAIVTQQAKQLKLQTDAHEMIAKRYELPLHQAKEWLEKTEWCYELTSPETVLQQATRTLKELKII